MTISKRSFIEGLQSVDQVLSPYEISQRVRLAIGCVSICTFDDELDIRKLRAYMKRDRPVQDRSPENPELFDCVVATNQSHAWQYVVWIKEILHIFDHLNARTDSKAALKALLQSRTTKVERGANGEPHQIADRNGFVLAMGSAVPRRYREVLRREKFLERYSGDELEKLILIPEEKLGFLLGPTFEDIFEHALETC